MSSFGTNTITGQQKKVDQRNLAQKEFISKAVKDILVYVQPNYDLEINQKILRNPMTKDFVHLLEHLIHKLDKSFKTIQIPSTKSKGKMSASQFDYEVVISIFEFFGYPFPLSKRNLTSIGAPHAWPSLLAALHWLVELNKYKDSTNDQRSCLDRDEEANQFFIYLSKSYQSYLHCESSDYVLMEDEIRKLFSEKDKEIISQIEKYLSLISELQKECDDYKESPLISLEKNKKLHETDIEKLKQLIIVKSNNRENLESKNESLDKELNQIRNIISKFKFERDILKKQIDQQEITPDEVKRMYNELNYLETTQLNLTKQYQELKEHDWNLEKDLRSANEEIQKTVQMFNKKATRLPQHLNVLVDSQDMKLKNIDSNLRTFQQENTSKLHHEQEINLKLKNESDKLEWEKESLIDSTNQLSSKIKKFEENFKKEKEQWRSELQQTSFQLESLEQENQSLKLLEQQDVDLKMSFRHMESLTNDLDKLQMKISNEEKLMSDLLYKTLELMTEHKAKNQNTLSNLEDKLRVTLNSITTMENNSQTNSPNHK
eukprot:gene3119-5289_t